MYMYIIFTSKFNDKMFSFYKVMEDLALAQSYLKDVTYKFEVNGIKNYSTHVIFLNDKGADAIIQYDSYFSDTKFVETIDEFINMISNQQVLTSVDIASHFESKEKRSIFKLLKTVYYIYADLLVESGVRPFQSKFEAWQFGPVDRDVYREKKYNSEKISSFDNLLLKVDSSNFNILNKLDSLEQKYSDSFNTLENNPTHSQGSPWYKVYDAKNPNMDPEINDTNILMNHKVELI